ncbi:MAG: choline/carnitine O-acyltransferase [candidate division KSB1 bacterium]|nr:choline/carnitine O-acyltransferase [candidate division KSB1 bacterium]MDZ7399734.1 choline/carnitine O-acyltransferase [candidate division KSB1 bacterium]
MEANERTRAIYEQLPAYPKPPLVPLPGDDDIEAFLDELGSEAGPIAKWVMKHSMALIRFRQFLRELPEQLETLLRYADLRGGGLFSPVISASLALKDDPRPISPIQRAATLIFAARSLYRDLMTGELPPDRFKDQILEMGQYPNLFSTCLIVEGKRARIFKSKQRSYIIVILAGRFYRFDIGDPSEPLTFQQLVSALEELCLRAKGEQAKNPISSPGILTVASHGTQLRIFQQLQQRPTNHESLEIMRHSFFTLCLDLDHSPRDDAESARIAHVGNNANRWFHASLQIVVFGNSRAAVICNFSTYLDGNPMMRAAAELQRRASNCPITQSNSQMAHPLPAAVSLRWDLEPQWLNQAEREFNQILDGQQATYEIHGFGKRTLEQLGYQPIPLFVVALLMALKKLVGRTVRITQFMTMSRYRCMDLVTPNVTTAAMARFVDYMERSSADQKEALNLLHDAIQSQLQAMRQARKCLPIPDALRLQLMSAKGRRRLWLILMFFLRVMIFRLLQVQKRMGREVLISHPEIYPEVPVVGRPGIRFPNVKLLGLHYQIWDDKIVITFMPGLKWNISNQDFIKALDQSLNCIKGIFQSELKP